jgi:hypothetical protein
VIDIEFHIVWIEATMVIGGRGVGGGLGADGLACGGEGGDRELLLWTAKLVDDDDVDLLEMLHERVEIVYLETAARVVATQFVLAVKGGEGVENGAAIALERGRELGALEVARAGGDLTALNSEGESLLEGAEELTGRAARIEATSIRAGAP